MASTLRFAEGEDTQQLKRDAEALLQQGWALDGEGMGITKTFHFKSYFKAVVSVAFSAEL
jgi:4a-hydroxytetrahydrobiopterin dehydratase